MGDRPRVPREGGRRSRRGRCGSRREPGCEVGREAEETEGGCPDHPHPLRVTPQGARRRRRAESALPARRHRAVGAPPRHPGARGDGRRALGRHDLGRPPQARRRPARHPHHDARVALPDADVAGIRDAAGRAHRHRRRGARGRGYQARGAPRREPRAARCRLGEARAAHRAVGDGAADRRGRTIPRRVSAGRGRRSARVEDVRSARRRPARRHAEPAPAAGDRDSGRRRHGGGCRRRRLVRRALAAAGSDGLGVAARRGGDRRPCARAPLHDRLRELAPARRAADRAAQRDLRRATRCGGAGPGDPRRDDGAGGLVGGSGAGPRQSAPRLGVEGAARSGRGRAEEWHAALRRRDELARARHRYGRGGPRHPGRGAALRGIRPAARRPRGSPGRRDQSRGPVPQASRRRAAHGRRDRAHARGADRGDLGARESARHPRAADDRGLRHGHDRCGGLVRDGQAFGAVSHPAALSVRGDARSARREVPLRRIRGAPAEGRLGPRSRHSHGAPRRAAGRRDERRDDPRSRPVRRLRRR